MDERTKEGPSALHFNALRFLVVGDRADRLGPPRARPYTIAVFADAAKVDAMQ